MSSRSYLSVLVLIAASFLSLLGGWAWSEPRLTASFMEELGASYGFYRGQAYSLDIIEEVYPDLSRSVAVARSEFDAEFANAFRSLNAYLARNLGDRWDKTRADIDARTLEALSESSAQLTRDQAVQFIDLVRDRAKGNVPSPYIEPLLIFDPYYHKKPEREFLDGYRYTFSSAGAPKARGLDFSIELPRTWSPKPGKRPHVLQNFVSQSGHGSAMLLLLVLDLELPPGSSGFTAADVEEILNPEDLSAFLPDGATYIASGPMVLETLPGFWLRYSAKLSRVRQTLSFDGIMFIAFYRDKMIQIQGQVLTEANGQEVEEGIFSKYEKLYELVANSFVLHTLYKR